MKRIILVCLILLSGRIGAECCCYYNPRNCLSDCFVLGKWLRLCLYLGGDAGYSWIGKSHPEIRERGAFSWGVFSGFNFPVCRKNTFIGIEGGYHDNGRFGPCRYRLTSQDVNISATFDCHFRQKFDFFFKAGGAHVQEKFKFCSRKSSAEEWAPVINLGCGCRLINCLRATISYRGIYCDQRDCSSVHSLYGGLYLIF